MSEAVSQSASQSASQPASQSVSQSASQPASQSVSQSVSQVQHGRSVRADTVQALVTAHACVAVSLPTLGTQGIQSSAALYSLDAPPLRLARLSLTPRLPLMYGHVARDLLLLLRVASSLFSQSFSLSREAPMVLVKGRVDPVAGKHDANGLGTNDFPPIPFLDTDGFCGRSYYPMT